MSGMKKLTFVLDLVLLHFYFYLYEYGITWLGLTWLGLAESEVAKRKAANVFSLQP